MDSCKVVSPAEDTPTLDLNMLFLYLKDIRKHYKEVKAKCKSDKKDRKVAAKQAAQLKCLLKYIGKDYASVKEALYPLLEASNITFDLLRTLSGPTRLSTLPHIPLQMNQELSRSSMPPRSSFMKGLGMR
jgi:hypothetical protein